MKIPKNILRIPRPKNTIVYPIKSDNSYGVRIKLVTVNEEGKRVYKNGPTIGHIYDGKYVALEDELTSVKYTGSAIKDWANIIVLDQQFKPILKDLKEVFNRKDALTIYCAALLLAAYPGIKFKDLKKKYDESYLSDLYPGVPMCANTIYGFIDDLGRAVDIIEQFLKKRITHSREGTKVIVDGTILTNNSIVNSLAEFNVKIRESGRTGINMLVAYDATNHEGLSYKLYSGNMSDTGVYADFMNYLAIEAGLIIGDKAFIETVVKDYMDSHPCVHYLYPLKRSSKLYAEYNLFHLDHQLLNVKNVLYKKVKLEKTDEWLYAFCDLDRKHTEESTCLLNLRRQNNDSLEEFDEKEPKMGTVVFVSDLDMDPTEVYLDYKERWSVEVVIRFYKEILMFKTISVHDDYSIMGEAFIRFIAFIGSLKLQNFMAREGLLRTKSYTEIMKLLRKTKKTRDPLGNWNLVELSKPERDILIKLGALEGKRPPVKVRKPGRPRKNPEEKAAKKYEKKDFMETKTSQRIVGEQKTLVAWLQKQREEAAREKAEKEKAKQAKEAKPKKRRGRPPGAKNKTPEERAAIAAEKAAKKRKRGRPRKNETRNITAN